MPLMPRAGRRGGARLIRFEEPKCNIRAEFKLRRGIHTNEKHRQSSGTLRTDDKKRVQEKFDALRRRSPRSAGRPCRRSDRSTGYTPEKVDRVLVTHLHSDHVGGITTQDGKRVFPNADVYVAKAESDFWLSPEIAAKAPKDAQPFFQSAQAIAAPYIKG